MGRGGWVLRGRGCQIGGGGYAGTGLILLIDNGEFAARHVMNIPVLLLFSGQESISGFTCKPGSMVHVLEFCGRQ